jgi:hypothetical protein
MKGTAPLSEKYNFVLKIETDGISAGQCLALALYDIDRDEMHSFADARAMGTLTYPRVAAEFAKDRSSVDDQLVYFLIEGQASEERWQVQEIELMEG